ncbi:MAG: 50S ribosomal protein L6 [Candidatus Magasanikbacteria bacterium RIFOXYD2_FULL_39_9]|uniref:Large ribosomal subunit protein uL6 n=1 Tax=Candidatus Magasanikbacteria bacterium RIFOXYD1_FULL_40_23 TaxID=1798705 RepID=A0A1F6P956_9BACT|nr:MAG: 50S ribosomal protein L6 [Candidatus Magasanikbacteria bacterium RIFOXYD2_FULL_39_9]OGH92707.1 MAG: 50S ribosomal protein L6 [Candidatus Magasanikbacteria bacterium RIFOXYD1_FULL_40_23]
MSRIGKKVITIPAGVTVSIEKDQVAVKGPKGELKLKLHPRVVVVCDKNEVTTQVVNENNKQDRALWGTFSSLVINMVKGVTEGFKKELEINGVGYKAAMKGTNLMLEVGFSHPVEIKPAAGVKFAVDKNLITIEGVDKQMIGEMAAQIRSIRKPEPYKGKGIKYVTEVIRRKAGKTAAKGAAA